MMNYLRVIASMQMYFITMNLGAKVTGHMFVAVYQGILQPADDLIFRQEDNISKL